MLLASIHIPYAVSQSLQTLAPYLSVAAFVLVVAALFFIITINRRLERLALGRTGSLEESIQILSRNMKETRAFRADLEVYLKNVEARLKTTVRGVGVIRFNPFKDLAGGNQSFAIALLDEKHSGVVFSALYARDRVSVYAKPIESGKSTFTLTEEEHDAVTKATTSLSLAAVSH